MYVGILNFAAICTREAASRFAFYKSQWMCIFTTRKRLERNECVPTQCPATSWHCVGLSVDCI
ncbi:hypothetical protein Mapa_013755 [Marchantia paleacea]|nr:hypothetical protein Mapa_013755 [Marchantia paleacea]